MRKKASVQFFAKTADLFDEHQLSSSLCLIFNGMASMIAIVFLVLFAIGWTETLFEIGIACCLCMTLANTTDLFPFWLKSIEKKLDNGGE